MTNPGDVEDKACVVSLQNRFPFADLYGVYEGALGLAFVPPSHPRGPPDPLAAHSTSTRGWEWVLMMMAGEADSR